MICQSYRAPLRQSLTGGRRAVTKRGKVRIGLARSFGIFVENLIYNPADGFIYRSSGDKILVISSAVCNVKRIAAASVHRSHGLFRGDIFFCIKI